VIVGFGVGYVMGSKAGRSRYDQIKHASAVVWESDPGRKVRSSAHRAVEEVQDKALGMLRSLTSGRPETLDLTIEETDHSLYR
jgi:hypothetical protein